MYKIGILTNTKDIFLPFLIKKINKIKKIKFYLIIARTKKNEKKRTKIFKERTGSFFSSSKFDFKDIKVDHFFVNTHNSKEVIEIIKINKINYLYNSSTQDKINLNILKKTKGVINIHPGILPQYRGCTCPEWALFNNDPLGVTTHFMSEKYDTGPIIKIKYLKFKKKDIKDYKDLRIKIYLLIINQAMSVFNLIVNKKLFCFKQDENNSKFYPVISTNKLNHIKKIIKNKKISFNKKNLI